MSVRIIRLNFSTLYKQMIPLGKECGMNFVELTGWRLVATSSLELKTESLPMAHNQIRENNKLFGYI